MYAKYPAYNTHIELINTWYRIKLWRSCFSIFSHPLLII